MRIGSMDFIITEGVIVLISCILAKLFMDVAALIQLHMQYEEPDREETISTPGITINLKDAASRHIYRIKWITGKIPEHQFDVGDHVEVLKNAGGHLIIRHFAKGEVHTLAIGSGYADRLRVEVDDHAYETE